MNNDLKLKVFISNYEDRILDLEHRVDDIVERYNSIIKKYSNNGIYIKPLLHPFYCLEELYNGLINYTWSAGSGYSSDDGIDSINTEWLFDDSWEQELIDELEPKYNETKEKNKQLREDRKIKIEQKKRDQYLKLKAEFGD